MAKALVLGGGAPNLTIMSGALSVFHEEGIEFDVITTSGAGMLVGMLYAAPKCGDVMRALSETRELGVSDMIYDRFPVNYKVFHKPGPLAEAYTRFSMAIGAQVRAMSPSLPFTTASQFAEDMGALMSAAMCPTDLSPNSLGLCQPAPWIEEYVDFDALRSIRGEFFLSAYDVEAQSMVAFGKDVISADHFRAALAMPFIYSPFKLDGKTFIEGSALFPLNYRALALPREVEIDTIVVVDALGDWRLIREPKSLFDAWVQSIIIPLVRAANSDTETFDMISKLRKNVPLSLLKVDWAEHVPEDHWPNVLNWSRSNLELLFDVGAVAARALVAEHGDALRPQPQQQEMTRDAA